VADAEADHLAEDVRAANLTTADVGTEEAGEPPWAKADLEGAGFTDRILDLPYLGPIPGHGAVGLGFGENHPRRRR